jgi:hypothetical protein
MRLVSGVIANLANLLAGFNAGLYWNYPANRLKGACKSVFVANAQNRAIYNGSTERDDTCMACEHGLTIVH